MVITMISKIIIFSSILNRPANEKERFFNTKKESYPVL